MATDNDPRPVLRQELARVFKNQRVIRAFEKIFDLIPPEFIDQQIQIDTVNLIAELAGSQAVETLAAVERLTGAINRLAQAPPAFPLDSLIGLISVPAIDQTIVPVWSATHSWSSAASAAAPNIGLDNTSPLIRFQETDQGADGKVWRISVNGGTMSFSTLTDAFLAVRNWIAATRTGNTIASIAFGNATDNPTSAFLGTGTVTFNGQVIQTTAILAKSTTAYTNGAAAAAGTLLNAPVAGNPTKWIPVDDNGTTRYIPSW